ncbi:hypothetical protein ACKGJO_03135 [Gracilimonas sp. Q87]|uniref:hypothetical protein n=1 Tax=Gracilimonas sp. Q87 TaxID=3384766 RepID=UPI003983EB61
MKRLMTVLAAVLFTTGMAFAQSNQATINQIGDDHVATVQQDNGIGNQATVDQEAVDQIFSTDPAEDNYAFVQQINGNYNRVDLDQGGNGDYADVRQNGYRNEADMMQKGPNDTDHYATLVQTGNYNTVDMFQDHNDNATFTAVQTGNNNDILSNQNGGTSFSTLLMDFIQTGNRNSIDARQNQGAATALIYQLNSDDNSAITRQTGGGHWLRVDQYSDNNTANITQTGTNNTSTVYQN